MKSSYQPDLNLISLHKQLNSQHFWTHRIRDYTLIQCSNEKFWNVFFFFFKSPALNKQSKAECNTLLQNCKFLSILKNIFLSFSIFLINCFQQYSHLLGHSSIFTLREFVMNLNFFFLTFWSSYQIPEFCIIFKPCSENKSL